MLVGWALKSDFKWETRNYIGGNLELVSITLSENPKGLTENKCSKLYLLLFLS